MRTFELAFELLSTLRSLPDIARKKRIVAYEVNTPTTVYIRASHSRIIIQRSLTKQVQIECDLKQAFGWDWVTERDEDGIYIILKRKPVVGTLSTAEVTVEVPPDAYLVFNLTPGSVYLADFEGKLSVAPVDQRVESVAISEHDSVPS